MARASRVIKPAPARRVAPKPRARKVDAAAPAPTAPVTATRQDEFVAQNVSLSPDGCEFTAVSVTGEVRRIKIMPGAAAALRRR